MLEYPYFYVHVSIFICIRNLSSYKIYVHIDINNEFQNSSWNYTGSGLSVFYICKIVFIATLLYLSFIFVFLRLKICKMMEIATEQ
jgi:hypothetical protein